MARLMSWQGAGKSRSALFQAIAIGLIFILIGAFGGLATAVMGSTATLFFTALLFGFFGLFVPLRYMVPALYIMSFVVVGQLIYFARIDKALWIPFLFGALLLIRFPFDLMQRSKSSPYQAAFVPTLPGGVKAALFVYFMTLIGSTLIHVIDPLQIFVSAKEYVFLWAVLLLLTFGLVSPSLVQRIWVTLPWLMVLQIPLVLYQRFVIAPSRAERHMGAEWDAIVGAFGGNPEGGGSSGAMGLFCVIGIAIAVARWRRGLLPGGQASLLIACGFVSIALAEIKFAVLLLPIALSLLYLRQIARKPVEGILAIVLAFTMSFTVLVLYKTQFANPGEQQTVSEYTASLFSSRSNDADFVNYRTREIGRVAALSFWWQQHSLRTPDTLLIGHGAGASRVGDMVVGEAARKWPFNIARSSMAVLLWEVGLLGTGAVIAFFIAAFFGLYRFVGDERLSAEQQTMAASMAVAVVVIGLGLPYNTDFLFSYQVQLLLLLSVGYLAMLRGQYGHSGRPVAFRSVVNTGKPELAAASQVPSSSQ